MDLVVYNHLTSFSRALDHLYPLVGSLRATIHDDGDSSVSISLGCTDIAVEFIHASAPGIVVSDILTPYYIPHVVHSFFPLNSLQSANAFSSISAHYQMLSQKAPMKSVGGNQGPWRCGRRRSWIGDHAVMGDLKKLEGVIKGI